MPHEVLLLYYSGGMCIFYKRPTGFRRMIEVLEDDLIFLGQNYYSKCPFSLLVPSLLHCPLSERTTVLYGKAELISRKV
jgi:hypothetical protein